jgi:carbonic anhydrase
MVMNNIEILKNSWNAIYDPNLDTYQTIHRHFHQDYEQCINGVRMNLDEYITHVDAQKKHMTLSSIDYKHFLEKENELFAIYYVYAKNIKGLPIEAEVISYFSFKDKKIFRIHGQVRLIKGELADVDMK